jgi:hypothetical protein
MINLPYLTGIASQNKTLSFVIVFAFQQPLTVRIFIFSSVPCTICTLGKDFRILSQSFSLLGQNREVLLLALDQMKGKHLIFLQETTRSSITSMIVSASQQQQQQQQQ